MGFILVALVTGYFLIPVSEDRINRSKFDRIQLGMSEDQVADLLGYDEMLGSFDHVHMSWIPNRRTISGNMNWSDEDGNRISVDFKESRVTGKEFFRSDRPFVERMRHRIELRIGGLWP